MTIAPTGGLRKGLGSQSGELVQACTSVETGKGLGATQLRVLEPGLGFRTARDRGRL